MAYNRKMRKFEGTCYIPGEQLAMMAKYYRGANLNLNLTLFEEDLSTLQETLDQACWCSKLDEVDRMKMSHMRGNEWRIAHEHCLEQGQNGRNSKVYPALPQNSKTAVCKVERGTSAASLYDRERGFIRGGQYQRDDYPETRRRGDYYDRQSRRDEYDYARNRRGYSDPRTREGYDARYRRDDYGPPGYPTKVYNEKRGARSMGGPPEQRGDVESEPAMSSVPDVTREIRCAVCNVETCMICKNHLYSPICQCKCPVANAGLCIRCSQEPCEEEEQVTQETRGNKMDLSSMMMTMMMSSMFKQSQAQESACCCKPSRNNSDSSSSDSSDGRVHKVYLYDCEDTKKGRKATKKSKKAPSSDSSSACNCCKCSRKPNKNSDRKGKSTKTEDEETSESDGGPKRPSAKGKGSKDSNKKSKGGISDSDSDAKPKGSKESNKKNYVENKKTDKNSKDEDAKSDGSDTKALNMKETTMPVKSSQGETRVSKNKGTAESRNVQFSKGEKFTSEPGVPRRSPSPKKYPPDIQISELLDTQHNISDIEPSNQTKKEDKEGISEESSTTFNLREFIVCLPKIQSDLQSLMYKLNQLDQNQHLQYQPINPSVENVRFRFGRMPAPLDVPLISSPQIPMQKILCNEPPQLELNPTQDSEISLGFSPGKLPDEGMLTGSNKHPYPINPPTRYHSVVNFPNLEPTKTSARDKKPQQQPVPAESTGDAHPTYKIEEEAHLKEETYKQRKQSTMKFLSPNRNVPQPYFERESATNCNRLCRILSEGGGPPKPHSLHLDRTNNVEIIEMSEGKSTNQIHPRKHGPEVHTSSAIATASSRNGGETIFHSYDREGSVIISEPDLTDYVSFSDEKHFQPSPALSTEQFSKMAKMVTQKRQNVSFGEAKVFRTHDSMTSKCSKVPQDRKSRSILKTSRAVTFKARRKNPLSLEKLVQGCAVRGSGGCKKKRRTDKLENCDAGEYSGRKHFDRGVGPGHFRRSKSDSSLDWSGNPHKKSSASPVKPREPKALNQLPTKRSGLSSPTRKRNEVVPRKNESPGNPVKEATHAVTGMKKSLESRQISTGGKTDLMNTAPDHTADQSDSVWKVSDAYVRRELDGQSYMVSSVEVRTISNNGSSDVIQMVQRVASSSLMNLNSAPPQAAPVSSDFDFLPLLPLSSTGESDAKGENQLQGAVPMKKVSFDDEVNSSTPAFLRKSRLQVEQLKRAHETIRSMIKNVNEVIEHIDSDSKIGIKAKNRNEDTERQSYFFHVDDRHQKKRPYKLHDAETGSKPQSTPLDKQTQEVQKMFLSVDRVLNAVLTPSDQSHVTPEGNVPSENIAPSRVRRDYFILNSDSSSTAFTESLRRSLENDESRSIPLATHPDVTFQSNTCHRPRSTRPLKQRSWFPRSKK